MVAADVVAHGAPLTHVADVAALSECARACWTIGGDRFGGATYIRLPAGVATEVQLRGGADLP